MNPKPIAEFVSECGNQKAAADHLGVARATIASWLRRGTKIYVIPGPDGGWTYYQLRMAG